MGFDPPVALRIDEHHLALPSVTRDGQILDTAGGPRAVPRLLISA